MNKLLIILFTFFVTLVVAQVPQGVGYQGVAIDANGIELVNQSISIRASVLSGSATGTIEWEETHTTLTDDFGLFTLTIGQGINTTNGAQASFADISWGTNTHFLKIEMDVTGGTNYSFMGTNQMMSVPYALYAENANINYDSITTLLSNDSTFITNIGGGIGGDWCQIQFPDGIGSESIIWWFNTQGNYTVPNGKTFYMLRETWWDGLVIVNGTTTTMGVPSGQPLIIPENSVITDGNNDGGFSGFLIDKTVESIIWWFNTQGNYTVPNGKTFYMLRETWWDGLVIVNGTTTTMGVPSGQPLIIPENSVITDGNNDGGFSGYLVDENYFAGCGGGGGSSSLTTINYDSLATIISMDSTFLANVGGGNMAFGEFEDITSQINNNITNSPPFPEFQQNEDGFLYIVLNPSNQWFQISIDSVSMLPNGPSGAYYYPNNPGYMSLLIPLKKDYYWTFGASLTSVNKAFWIPLESGGGSSNTGTGNMVVSTFGDTLTMNGQSIIVPGISYQNVVPIFGSVTDASGNTYQTLQIGSQEWMAENLRTTKYADGSDITFVTSGSSGSTPYYMFYDNDFSNVATFGCLYNGHAIMNSQNVCPTGWHVPTDSDWEQLFDVFGDVDPIIGSPYGWTEVGGPLKSLYTFNSPNFGATNESYMSMVAGGQDWGGGFSDKNNYGMYWTSSTSGGSIFYFRFHKDNTEAYWGVNTYYYAGSVRCVKD